MKAVIMTVLPKCSSQREKRGNQDKVSNYEKLRVS